MLDERTARRLNRAYWDSLAALDGSYADPAARLAATESVQYGHSLGELVTAAVQAGLRVERLDEHLDLEPDQRRLLAQEDDGRYRLRLGAEAPPPAFTPSASRSGRRSGHSQTKPLPFTPQDALPHEVPSVVSGRPSAIRRTSSHVAIP